MEGNSASRTAVLRVDGGICSQIAFVAFGEKLREQGLLVRYDLSWYRECGKDNDGRFVRNFDFRTAFPGIPIEEATAQEIDMSRQKSIWHGTGPLPKPPFFYPGYDGRLEALFESADRFASEFRPVPTAEDRDLLAEIASESEPCAIHVRRGDLSTGQESYYGKPASVDYFTRAVRIMCALVPQSRFFIFSDEPDWVRSRLLPVLSPLARCRICDRNGSDRGYADLFAISRCRHVIASQGSLGTFGALLSGGRNRTLILRKHDAELAKRLPTVIYVNDDVSA